jgi:WD40 repeat protein
MPPEENRELQIFVSYSRKDATAAEGLVADLERSGFRVALDKRDLPYGEEWQAELRGFIEGCDATVWLVTPDSVNSQWCIWELGEVHRLAKRLIPIRIRETRIEDVPNWLRAVHMLPADGLYSPALLSTLVKTIESDNKWIKQHTRIGNLARRWEALGRPDWELLRGESLSAAEKWLIERPRSSNEPTTIQREFVSASREARIAEEGAAEESRRRELEQAHNLAEEQSARADTERRRRTEAASRQLAAQSLSIRESQFDLALLLAIEANRLADTAEARNVLLHHVIGNPHLVTYLNGINLDVAPGAKVRHQSTVAFSIDGAYVAHAEGFGAVRLKIWRLNRDTSLTAVLDIGEEPIGAIAFSPDSSLLAAIDESACLWLWDLLRWHLRYVVRLRRGGESELTGSLAFNPDGTRMAIGSGTTVFFVETVSGEISKNVELISLRSADKVLWPRSSLLVAEGFAAHGEDLNAVTTAVIDPDTQKEIRLPAECLGVDSTGRRLWVRAKESPRLDQLDLDRVEVSVGIPLPEQHHYRVWSSHDGESVLTDGESGFLLNRRTKIEGWAPPRRLVGHGRASGSYVNALAFSPDDSIFASSSVDDSVILWTVEPNHRLRRPLPRPNAGENVSSALLAFNAGEPYHVANLDEDGRIFATCIESGVCLPLPTERFAYIEARGAGWIGLTNDYVLCKIEPGPSLQIRALSRVDQPVVEFALARSADCGVFVSDPGELFGLDLASLSLRRMGTADLGSEPLIDVPGRGRIAISPDGSRVAIARSDGLVTLITPASGAPSTIETGLEEIRISFVHSGRTLLVMGLEAFQLWEVETQTALVQFGTGSTVGAPVIAAASHDGSFFVWRTLFERGLHVMDGRATQELCLLPQDQPQSLTFSPDGRFLAVDDGAGGVNLWSFALEDWTAVARQMSNRSITRDEWRRFMPDTAYPARTDSVAARTQRVMVPSATLQEIRKEAIEDVVDGDVPFTVIQAATPSEEWLAQREIAMPAMDNQPDRSASRASPSSPASSAVVLSGHLDPLILGVAIGLMTAWCWSLFSGSLSKHLVEAGSAAAPWAVYTALSLFTRYRYHRWLARAQQQPLLLKRCVGGASMLLLCVSIWELTTIARGPVSARSVAFALGGVYVVTIAWNVVCVLTRPATRKLLASESPWTSPSLRGAIEQLLWSRSILATLWQDISSAGMLVAAVLYFG